MTAIKEGLCTPAKRAKCAKSNGPWLDQMCRGCPSKRPEDLHPYTRKLLDMRGLQRAGYPLEADDLELEEWLDLGRVRDELECRERNAAGHR